MVLKLLGDKKEYQSKEIKDYICKEFKLTEEELNENFLPLILYH